MFVEVISPSPILNTSDFFFAFGGNCGNEIPLNEQGHPYCFEFVALKGMVFQVDQVIRQSHTMIFRISCPFYIHKHLYLDSRFTRPAVHVPPQRSLPPSQEILNHMIEMVGTPYVWGGNWRTGIPELLVHYPSKGELDDKTAIYWTLQGVDCSGLLFEASRGSTPRNTSQLIHFGKPVAKNSPLNPLDMILYPGHVLFVVDKNIVIESKFPFGVILRDLQERLWELDAVRTRTDNWTQNLNPQLHYIVRRFIPRTGRFGLS